MIDVQLFICVSANIYQANLQKGEGLLISHLQMCLRRFLSHQKRKGKIYQYNVGFTCERKVSSVRD